MTDTEWKTATVEDVEHGDPVRLEHGDGSVLIRRASNVRAPNDILTGDTIMKTEIVHLVRDLGWSLFVPVPPKPEQPPTKPGAYKLAGITSGNDLFVLDGLGKWWDFTGRQHPSDGTKAAANTAYHPMTKLEDPKVTATAILKRVIDLRYIKNFDDAIAALAAEFGADL
jgi:hypothetical protein